MKKTLFLLLILTVMAKISAQPVGIDKAQAIAKKYIGINEPQMAHYALTASPEFIYTDDCGTPVMYAFNIGNIGFILVGANESFSPIVGYSFNGTFDSNRLPDNLKAWLNGYVEDVCAIKNSETKAADILAAQTVFRAEWQALEYNDAAFYSFKGSKNVNALVETHWDQGTGYNNYCPIYNGSHCVTGCVATAMAQIIRYHRYPNIGYSSHTYQHATYGTLSANFDSTYYDYTLMPNTINYYSSAAQQNAVSLLCYHCGISVNMNYQNPQHTSGSGAHSESVPNALLYFGYANSFYLNKNGNNDIWDSLLRHDLDLARPVYYSGSNSEGGHAFVCDGYKSNGQYHFNFGWGGYGDGFYTLSSVNGYSSSQGAVFNIVPSQMGPMQNILYIASDGDGNGSSWSSAYPNLEYALGICSLYKKSTIWIKNGTYYGDTTSNVAFTIPKGITIYGGFAGTESSIDDRDLNSTARTILSGNNKRAVLYSPTTTTGSKLYDITLANGLAEDGAGADFRNEIRFERCIFENNRATAEDGAAVNSTTGYLYCCIFRNNQCSAVNIGNSYIKNSLIVHNDGYGIKSQNGYIDGCDIVCNSGVGTINQSGTKIRNSIFWHNDSSLTDNNISNITFCAIEGFGEKDSNSNVGLSHINRPNEGIGPFFIAPDTTIGPAPEMGDWQLSSLSPLIDAGDTNRVGSYITELGGDSRFRNGRADIGCYEHNPYLNIETPNVVQSIRVYPNPASNTITIESTSSSIDIYDIMGRCVSSATANNGATTIDISRLPNGVYLLRTNNTTTKFLKISF